MGRGDGASRCSQDGSLPTDGAEQLREASGAPPRQGVLAGEACEGSHKDVVATAEAGGRRPPYQPFVGFHLQGLQRDVPRLVESFWGPGHAIPNSSQWPINRQESSLPIPVGSAKKRPMEGTQVGGALEGGPK